MRREPVPQDDDVAYRDYLFEVYARFTRPTHDEMGPNPTEAELVTLALQRLRDVMKQDFATTQNTVIGAFVVPVQVLQRHLTEDLGVPAGDLPDGPPGPGLAADLVAAAGADAFALSRRLHIDLGRTTAWLTTRVRENIDSLQRFLRTLRTTTPNHTADPFFLYKAEWRARHRRRFFPENHYQLPAGLFATAADRARASARLDALLDRPPEMHQTLAERMGVLLALDAALSAGHRAFTLGALDDAAARYTEVEALVARLRRLLVLRVQVPGEGHARGLSVSFASPQAFIRSLDPHRHASIPDGTTLTAAGSPGEVVDIPAGHIPSTFPFTGHLLAEFERRYADRRGLAVDTLEALAALEARAVVAVDPQETGTNRNRLFRVHDDLLAVLPHLLFFVLPLRRAELAVARGDWTEAANQYARVAVGRLLRGHLDAEAPGQSVPGGDLPWSWAGRDTVNVIFDGTDYGPLNAACEGPWLELRLGALYLQWADALYRVDQQAEVQRARVLFGAVLRQYGIDPEAGAALEPLPPFDPASPRPSGPIAPMHEVPHRRLSEVLRPAVVGARRRIRVPGPRGKAVAVPAGPAATRVGTVRPRIPHPAIVAVPPGLWGPVRAALGDPHRLAVPDLEYAAPTGGDAGPFTGWTINPARVAQQLRARAGVAQIDAGLNVLGHGHDVVPLLRYPALATAAERFVTLARQAEDEVVAYTARAEDAELDRVRARFALTAAALRVRLESERVLAARSQVEIAELQLAGVDAAITAKEAEIESHSGFGGQVKDFFSGLFGFAGKVPSQIMNIPVKGFKAGTGGFIGGAAAASGFALFGVGAAVGIGGIVDGGNTRRKQLKTLQTQTRPLAVAGLAVRERELAIAQLQVAVARLDADVAFEVLRHLEHRTLSAERWAWLATEIRLLLRRYLDLANHAGWLAERALAFDQRRDLRMIRFDYYQPASRGFLSSESLSADLAALDGSRISGAVARVPIVYTLSLMEIDPLAFGQLKLTGQCRFSTDVDLLEQRWPETWDHRVLTVEVAPVVPAASVPPTGHLATSGLSVVAGERPGELHDVVRPPASWPVSAFERTRDAAPADRRDLLRAFEGGGFAAEWALSLRDPGGLDALGDVLITFHLEARSSAARPRGVPTPRARMVILSAAHVDAAALRAALVDEAPLALPVSAHVPPGAVVRAVVIGALGGQVNGRVTPGGESVEFATQEGLAWSLTPEAPTDPPASLAPLVGRSIDGDWTLELSGAGDSIEDLWLAIEYGPPEA